VLQTLGKALDSGSVSFVTEIKIILCVTNFCQVVSTGLVHVERVFGRIRQKKDDIRIRTRITRIGTQIILRTSLETLFYKGFLFPKKN
jgi:hypothetical protein